MLTALLLLITFTALGLPLLSLIGRDRDYLLAPAFGLATWVLLGYLLSANFGMTGGTAMSVALGMMGVLTAVTAFRLAFTQGISPYAIGRGLRAYLLYAAPALLLLIPALYYGVDSFYGAVNFDFFFNSRDALYLATHSVDAYSIANDNNILPLTWSADPQGRFGIGLIGAFAAKLFEVNTVRFNAELLTALLFVTGISFAGLIRRLFVIGPALICGCVVTYLFSAGFAQGYIYFLLGQISAFPLMITALALAVPTLAAIDQDGLKSGRALRLLVVLALLLNALYIFYAILAVFTVAIIGLAALIHGLQSKAGLRRCLQTGAVFAVMLAGSFLLLHLLSLAPAIDTMTGWFKVSAKTVASTDKNAFAVFTEYLTESFLPLIFGILPYPTSAAIFELYGLPPLLMACIGLPGAIAFTWCLVRLYRNRTEAAGDSLTLALLIAGFGSGLLFFAAGSGYSTFKIGCWLMPFLPPVLLVFIVRAWNDKRRSERVWSLFAIVTVCANLLSASIYVYSFLATLLGAGSFENAKNVNGLPGIEPLRAAIEAEPGKTVLLDLKNGLRQAWVANELPQSTIVALSQNKQPLDDRLLPAAPCDLSRSNRLEPGSLLVTSADNGDIIANNQAATPVAASAHYKVYRVGDLKNYGFVGAGAFPPEFVTAPWAPNGKIRWVEHGIELYYLANSAQSVTLKLGLMPGYAPQSRTLTLTHETTAQQAQFDETNRAVEFKIDNIKAGLNCFLLEAPAPNRPQREHALIRPNILQDPRLLNFAITDLAFIETPGAGINRP